MHVSGAGLDPTEPFGLAKGRGEENLTEVASGHQEAPADAAYEAGGEEGEARLAPNEGQAPRRSFAEQLEDPMEA